MNRQNRWKNAAALSFALGGLQYLLAEKIAALAWSAPVYHYGLNYISDLGIPHCGVLADGRAVCSPLHTVMNVGFAVEGVLFFIACLLLRKVFNGAGKFMFLCTGLLHGAGGSVIALFHSGSGEAGLTLHEAGAVMAIGGGNLCLTTVGWLLRQRPGLRDFSLFSLFMGSFGLICMVMIPMDLLPTGIIERASVYPITFWQIFTGCLLLKTSHRSLSGGTRL